ncbi:dienelactone hydrolase family protein [Comamonas sp. GB3 AK4-5]|uniref:dienelactone hydrolase family protein n=1 Tax=Comamonas sp. GB3 AK4-5 TaxID=3231487 RepID=UPI00351E1997
MLDLGTHWKPVRRMLGAAMWMAAICLPHSGNAQVSRLEVTPLQSVTLSDQEFLIGREDGKPVVIAGELRLPGFGAGRRPLVILLHGSGGPGWGVVDWEQKFLDMGVATFVLDSFTGRGIVDTTNDQAQLGRLTQTVDAYRALALLSRHPRIDPHRIMLIGFSRGGQNALYASLKRFQRMHLTSTTPPFAAYVAFYPDCSYTYRDDEELAPAPVRIFHGTADTFSRSSTCRAYVQRLRAKGQDIQITEYPGAQHVFDSRILQQPIALPQAQSTRNCQTIESEEGKLVSATTRQPFSYADACVERGATMAYDEQAATEAEKAVRKLVTEMLKPLSPALLNKLP